MIEAIKWVICLVLIVLAWPIGIFLASKTKEELKDGKKWFKAGIIFASILAVGDLIFIENFNLKMSILTTLAFIGIILFESVIYKKPN